jgi:hypothetical protein
MHDDLRILIDNYKTIHTSLGNYPEWKYKFESDVSKVLEMTNIYDQSPEIFEILVNYIYHLLNLATTKTLQINI